MKKMVMSALVVNTAGVLARVAGLFSRRNYNIDSLTVSETLNPKFSTMTIVVHGEDEVLEQIRKQVAKLEDVKRLDILKEGKSVCRELSLIRLKVTPEQRLQVIAITDTDIFQAKIVDVDDESLIIEFTGSQRKIDALINLLKGYEIQEVVRTGVTGLARGGNGLVADGGNLEDEA